MMATNYGGYVPPQQNWYNNWEPPKPKETPTPPATTLTYPTNYYNYGQQYAEEARRRAEEYARQAAAYEASMKAQEEARQAALKQQQEQQWKPQAPEWQPQIPEWQNNQPQQPGLLRSLWDAMVQGPQYNWGYGNQPATLMASAYYGNAASGYTEDVTMDRFNQRPILPPVAPYGNVEPRYEPEYRLYAGPHWSNYDTSNYGEQYAVKDEPTPPPGGGGGWGEWNYPRWGGGYPTPVYPEAAKSWYENMLQWRIS